MNAIQKLMRVIIDAVKKAVSTVVGAIYNCIETYFPGGNISLVILSLNGLALCVSTGLLFIAVVSGLLACVSVAALWFGASDKIRNTILRVGKHGSWWMDLGLTTTLTVLGFSLGPTMGLMGVMLGLDMTVMFAILRWMANRKDKKELNSREETVSTPKLRATPISMKGAFA